MGRHRNPKPFGYWTVERITAVAKRYSSRKQFMNAESGAYQAACKKGIVHEACSHMITTVKLPGHWNSKEKCISEALKYSRKKDFMKLSNGAYAASLKHGWLDEICSHMKVTGNRFNRGLYVWQFDDKSAYIGLTYDYATRYQQHLKKGTIFKKLKKTSGKFKTLDIFYSPAEAQIEEQKLIEKYRKSGWSILNRVKAGALGSIDSIWDMEGCLFAASFCSTYQEFSEYFLATYKSVIKNDWIDEVRVVLQTKRKRRGYCRNKKNCKDEALKYNSRVDFMKGSPGTYKYAMQNRFVNEICSHMTGGRRPNGYYTKRICKISASGCRTRMEFKSKYSTAYAVSVKRGWIDGFFKK